MRGLFGLSKKISAGPTSTFFLDPGLPRWRSCQILSNFLWRGIQKYDFSDYQKYRNLILNFISCFWGYRTKLEYDKLKVNGVHRDHPPAWATAYYASVVVKLSDFFSILKFSVHIKFWLLQWARRAAASISCARLAHVFFFFWVIIFYSAWIRLAPIFSARISTTLESSKSNSGMAFKPWFFAWPQAVGI